MTHRGRPTGLRPTFEPPPGCAPDSIVLSFPVAREFAGQRLDQFIQSRIPRLSRTRAKAICKAGAFRLDGTRRRPSDLVRAGETVLLVRQTFQEPDAPREMPLLYSDRAVAVIDKPAGLPVHPSASYHRNTVSYILRERHGDEAPRITHRLDRETSGVLLCARSLDVERRLKQAFEGREVRKAYLAIVRGEMTRDEGQIDLPMARAEEGLHMLMCVSDRPDALEASTHFQVLLRAGGHSLVGLWPRTGRQHQLRVHLTALGHPIMGDKLYGPEGQQPFLDHIETGMTDALAERLGHTRHALHAHRLQIAHPLGEGVLDLVSPLPEDLHCLWESLTGERPVVDPLDL